MGRILALLYGVVAYGIFFLTFLYAIGWVGNLLVPKSIDHAHHAPLPGALTVDVALLAIFAVQHSLMARPAFKRWWTRFVPQPVERSTYVLFASGALILLFWQWRQIPAVIWSVSGAGATALWALFWAGWGLVLASTFLINHFELFGLRQVWANMARGQVPGPQFRTPLFYRVVRHPLYLGFILAFWATPRMTAGHLLFAVATLAYILIAIQLEERDLVGVFGETYLAYRRRVSMLIPLPPRTGERRTIPQVSSVDHPG
jgi:protein-S-isoprenylcysteine O-methyltransferase Ste14